MELLHFINEKPVVPKFCYRVTYRCKLKSETNWRKYVDYSKFQTEEETLKAFWVVKRKDAPGLDFEITKLEKIPYEQAKSEWIRNLKSVRRVLGERKTKMENKTIEEKIDFALEKMLENVCEEKRNGVKPVARTIAEMAVRCCWPLEGIGFKSSAYGIMFTACNDGGRNISDYNYAWQVKLCLNEIENAGLFM